MSSQTHKIRDLAQDQLLLNKGKGLDKEEICDMEARCLSSMPDMTIWSRILEGFK